MKSYRDYLPPEDLLHNRVILVTGAGQGLGRAAAIAYAKHGAVVILHGRTLEKLECVYDEIMMLGKAEPVIHSLDFEKATENDYDQFAQAITEQFGRLDGILHSAAFLYEPSPIEFQTFKQWQVLLQVNVIAPFALTKACFSLLKSVPDASVILTAGTQGHNPTAYWGGFSAAKAGIEAWVKTQADEWSMLPGLRINAVIPGVVNTTQRIKTHPGEMKSKLTQPEDLMPLYLFLMGPESKVTKGEIIHCQTQ